MTGGKECGKLEEVCIAGERAAVSSALKSK